ncbi:MAG: hypothetical protein EOO77_42495, partial [Oxalobacteraceae bacterium]
MLVPIRAATRMSVGVTGSLGGKPEGANVNYPFSNTPPERRDAARRPDRLSSSMPETLWQPSSDTLRIRSILYLVVLDCAVILGCFSAVALARGMLFQSNWILFASVLVPLHVIVGISTDGYAASIRSEPFRAIRKGEQALMIALATVTLVSFFLKTSQVFPRLT